MKSITTIVELLRHIESCFSKPNALNYQAGLDWKMTSTQELVEQVKHCAMGLKSLGVKKGDMVGILADSSPRWMIADMAIMCSGAVSVPLFANISSENFDYINELTKIKYLFVSGSKQWEVYKHFIDRYKGVFCLYEADSEISSLPFHELIDIGRQFEAKNPEFCNIMLDEVKPNDMATIIFTSGTTGLPKGAVFHHENICGAIANDRFKLDNDKDIFLNPLPMAHIYARMVNFFALYHGVPIYYIKDLTLLGNVCKELKPTMAIVVPRILEKIYAKLIERLHEASIFKRRIMEWAFNLSIKKDSIYKKIMFPLADSMVYSKIREELGGHFRFIASGGAKLSESLHEFYSAIGITICEGWGMTEAGIISAEPLEDIRLGSVGTLFEGYSIKLGENSEILLKGICVMQGYYKNETATKEAFTEDGWLRTGDRGTIDAEGFIRIEGRLKEIYKTSTGECIVPVPIELELVKAPLIEVAMVVGDGKKFASCLLFPNFNILRELKKNSEMEALSDEEFLNSAFIQKKMKLLLNQINQHLNEWEQIHAYRFILNTPTVEGGELTPTLKLRREVILKRYHDQIESMYFESAA